MIAVALGGGRSVAKWVKQGNKVRNALVSVTVTGELFDSCNVSSEDPAMWERPLRDSTLNVVD